MANVQVEDGFVRIANSLCEALYRLRIPGNHKDVIACVIRFTYGFNRTEDTFASSQLAKATGIEARNVRGILADLVDWGIINRRGNGKNRPYTLSIVKDFDRWNVTSTKNARLSQARKAGSCATREVGSSATRAKSVRGSCTTPLTGSSATRRVGSCTPVSKDKRQKDSGAVAHNPIDPYRIPPDTPTLPAKIISDLIAVKPHGVVYSREDVQIWFAAKVPKMRLRGIKNLKAAAKKWWPNIKPGEVQEARQWLRDVNSRARAEEIKAEMVAQPDPGIEITPEQIEEASLALH